MLKKLFNKKTMIVYIVILCLTLIAGSVSAGFAFSYSVKYDKAVEEATSAANKEAGLDETSQAVLNLITNALEAYTKTEGTASSNKTEVINDEAKAYKSSKTASIIAAVVLYVFSALSIAGIITSVEYEKYLHSEKYKAKLKRMKKYEHSYNTGM